MEQGPGISGPCLQFQTLLEPLTAWLCLSHSDFSVPITYQALLYPRAFALLFTSLPLDSSTERKSTTPSLNSLLQHTGFFFLYWTVAVVYNYIIFLVTYLLFVFSNKGFLHEAETGLPYPQCQSQHLTECWVYSQDFTLLTEWTNKQYKMNLFCFLKKWYLCRPQFIKHLQFL